MARTSLLRAIRRLAKVARHDQILNGGPAAASSGVTRRQFASQTAIGLGAAAVVARNARAFGATRQDKSIVIVGAGIAGLNAALTLADAGVAATIYEAADHAGGRMRSHRGFWNDGQVTEWCGELIDSEHETIRALAARFELPLDDLVASQAEGATETFFVGGQYYSAAQAAIDFAQILPALLQDAADAGDGTTYDQSTPGGRALDSMSIYEWIETRVPGGHQSAFGKVLEEAYTIEYGAPTSDQSALNLIVMLSAQPTGEGLAMFGSSDERFHIRGGNQQLPEKIAASMAAQIQTGHRLVALRKRMSGGVELHFRHGFGTRVVYADKAIIAIPFATLAKVDLRHAGFDQLKLAAIHTLGRARNGKLHLQFDERLWSSAGPWGVGTGTSYSDTGYQCTWEPTRGQPGVPGILVNFTGGAPADQRFGLPFVTDSDPRVRVAARKFLREIEPVFPGLSARWNGKAASSHPHLDPNLGLSYSYWRVGQYQSIAGAERLSQGDVLFAGEHCSTDYQGYMEGAAVEGARAAAEILSSPPLASSRAPLRQALFRQPGKV